MTRASAKPGLAETTTEATRQRSERYGKPEFHRGGEASRTAGFWLVRKPLGGASGAPACSWSAPAGRPPPLRGRANGLADRARFAYALSLTLFRLRSFAYAPSEESVADVPTGGWSEPIACQSPTGARGLVGKSRLFHLRSGGDSAETMKEARFP